MREKLKKLHEQMAALNAQARAIIDAGDATAGGPGKGQLRPEESARVDAIYAEYDKLAAEAKTIQAQIDQRARLAEHDEYLSESAGRQAAPATPEPQGRPGEDPHAGYGPPPIEYRGRPLQFAQGSPAAARCGADYARAFNDYLMGMQPRAALQTATGPAGGYLAPMQVSMQLIQALDNLVWLRQLSTVLPPLTTGASLGIPTIETDASDAAWTAEIPATDIAEDTTMQFGHRELTPHMIAKLIAVSKKLLRVASQDPAGIVMQRLAYKKALAEETAFLTGNGARQPLGVLTASADGVPTARDTNCAAVDKFTADELLDCFYSLKESYRRNATWIFNRLGVRMIRKFKTGDGQYLWQPGLAGQPGTICDRPYYETEIAMGTFTTQLYVGIVGDFRAGYWIVDSLDISVQVLTELLALTNKTGFLMTAETDAMPVLGEAFARLKLA